MGKRIGCNNLGIANCEFSVEGQVAEDVAKEMVDHLRTKHNVDLPDTEDILAGDFFYDPLQKDDPAAGLIVTRLREALDIDVSGPAPRLNPIIPPVNGSIPRQS